MLMGTRSLIAGSILCLAGRLGGAGWPSRIGWLRAVLFGLLFFTLGHGLLAFAQVHIGSGLASILLATTPLWVPLVGWFLPGGRMPSARVSGGLLLGFVGVVVLLSARAFGGAAELDPVPAAIVLFSAFCWGSGSSLVSRNPVTSSPALTAGLELLIGGATLVLVSALTGEFARADLGLILQPKPLAGFVYMIVFASLIGFYSYLYLLSRVTPERAATYAYVNPLIAVTLGALVAGEKLTVEMAIAGALILAAVILVLSKGGGGAQPRRAPAMPDIPPDRPAPAR